MASDSSEDDRPLARPNGRKSNSTPRMSSATTAAPLAGPAISIRNGPVEDRMDVDSGMNGKRKSRSSIDNRVSYKDASDSDSAPLAKRRKSKHQDSDSDDEPIANKRTKKLPVSVQETALISSDDDDAPIVSQLIKKKASIEKTAAKTAADLRAKEANGKKRVTKVESSDDEPLAAQPKKRQSNGVAASKKTNGTKVESDSDVPLSKKKATPKASAKAAPKGKAAATPVKKEKAGAKKPKLEEDEDEDKEGEEEFEWWNAPKKEDDSVKWETLEHNGVAFPPPYEPLPKNVRLLYDGKPVELAEEAEEVATFFGSMLHSTQNVENPVFQKNFFSDFQDVLKQTGGAKDKQGNKVAIKDFDKLDFTKIFAHFQALNEAKKARSKEEKKADKDAKTKEEEPFMFCKWDGRKQKVGNFRVEPPGLFRGRGQHPKTGRVKKRVMPEQITINIGKGAKVPSPPPGHKWKAVQHDNKATWLAMWQENINNAYKYVMLAANSDIKGMSDYKKFEKARELKKHIDRIRADYSKDLKSDVMADRQRATAMYLIDKLALRAGNEKDTDNEADTVGCCSLKYEHITLKEEGNTVIFDFLGKDSIRYYDEVSVDRQVFKNLKMFKKPPKEAGDDIFDRLNTSQLNKHLSSYMTGLTAKVFRTYNASFTMSQLLMELDDKKGKQNLTMAEKVKLYNDCNRKVAILCNHKRTVGAAHDTQMEKLGDRIKGLKYQKWRTKMMMIDVEPKMKKKKGAEFFEKDADLTDEWIAEHQAFLVEEMRTKITKKFEKDNEKRAAEGEKPLPEKELKERLKAASELKAKLDKENKSKKVLAEGKAPSVEKLEAAVQKIEERIHSMELQAADKDDNKEVALGTSKINYIDPRLTVVFVNKVQVPIEKFFSKTLRDKFNWAIKSIGDDDSWEF